MKLSPGGTTQRKNILDTALALMSQKGVDGTSMRDLAAAAGLNVASLYHYFPSKRELLIAVLEERGLVVDATPSATPIAPDATPHLNELMADMLQSMLEVEEFIRLMLGEVMRGEETAHNVGVDLFSATQDLIEGWLQQTKPELCERVGATAVAHLLRAAIIGLFFEYVAGMLDGDPMEAFRERATEIASILD